MNENKTNINWLITIQSRPVLKHYNIRENAKIDFACSCKNIYKTGENQ